MQGVQDRFSDIVLATGSGGSTAGLSIANYLTKSNLKCHGMTVCDTSKYFSDHINDTLKEVGLSEKYGVQSDDIVDLVDGVKGEGYGVSTQEELGKDKATAAKKNNNNNNKTGIWVRPTQRTSHNFNENQPMHQKRNFLKIFCSQIQQKSRNVFFEPHS